ncbi:WecB/TagA/CpsF family glycosyltransferase [Calothrix sp. 336/3]|uniref:WecB/TagA/CpsF family glycosyltransferase n=1 Tax=Calothrix sp. 336/3 TaxID=1337936 RepID=UPI0004E3709F|nr:WecB/TagA/CpsF family glycosyltransferase [Calothrix sp. 336/3]AKG22461.1 glycosyl transferase [Calothrix sp. 336/3]
MGKVRILNLDIDNLSLTELLAKLETGMIFTPNVDHLIKLQSDSEFLQAYNTCDYKLCDSQLILYAAKFLGTPFQEKISGSDLFPAFYQYHQKNHDIRIFLLGAAQGIALTAQNKINQKVGRDIIVASYSPPFGFENNFQECQKIINMINRSKATVLVIGVGAPKQEKWLAKYKDLLPGIKIFMALGATIDFEAGNIQRAPKWMSQVGLEWLFRLLCEPKRLWRRYLVEDTAFFSLILKQKIKNYMRKKHRYSTQYWQLFQKMWN